MPEWPAELRMAAIVREVQGASHADIFVAEDPPGEFEDEAIYVSLHSIRERLLSDEAITAVACATHPRFNRYGKRKQMAAMWDAKRLVEICVMPALDTAFPSTQDTEGSDG
jgi:hypothetical protein